MPAKHWHERTWTSSWLQRRKGGDRPSVPAIFCSPYKVIVEQFVVAAARYLEGNPQRRHEPR
jgi:hypothetical protein